MIAKLAFFAVAVVVVLFAIGNRAPVTVDLWPLPFNVDLPLYLAVLGALAAGILLGGIISWFSSGKWRRRARAGERRSAALERDARAAAASEAPRERAVAALPDARRQAALTDE